MDKLAKFFGLVRNEYIKINKKISTKIMLILLLLSICAIPLLAAVEKNHINDEDFNYIEDYNNNIAWLQRAKPEGYEIKIAQLNMLLDNKISYDDWRYDMITETDILSMNSSELGQLNNIIASNDWKSYLQKKLTDNTLSSGQRWACSYRLENNISFDEQYDKQNAIIDQVAEAKDQIELRNSGNAAGKPDGETLSQADQTVLLGTYQLENNIPNNTAEQTNLFQTDDINFWSVFMTNKLIVSVVGFIIIVFAGGIIAMEFSQGTIKFLLINPVKRGKILAAKYFTCITYGYILIAVVFLLSIPITGLFIGFDGINTPYLYVENGTVHEMSTFIYAIKLYLLSSISMVVMATLAFAISYLVRSSALAIGISVFFMCTGNTIMLVLNQLKQDWGRYLIFANTDLASIMDGSSLFPSHTLTFAVTVIVAHMAVFLLTAWDGFTKKSV